LLNITSERPVTQSTPVLIFGQVVRKRKANLEAKKCEYDGTRRYHRPKPWIATNERG